LALFFQIDAGETPDLLSFLPFAFLLLPFPKIGFELGLFFRRPKPQNLSYHPFL